MSEEPLNSSNKNDYGADSIKVLEGLEAILSERIRFLATIQK